jgi:glycosyltransferase involved in cell wall biosynthesis
MGLKILIAAGMIDRKLYSKIEPILENPKVERVYLVRRDHFAGHPKIVCYSPTTGIWKNKRLAEIYRIIYMIKVIIKQKPDLLIGIGMIPHGLFINILGRIFRKKTILCLMGKNDLFLTYPNRKVRQWFLLKIAKWANIIGTRGHQSEKWLISKGVKKDNIFIPHNVFSFNEFYKIEQEKKYNLIYVGFINFYKRVDLLIDVVEKLVYQHNQKNIKLAVIGKGKLKEKMIAYARKKKVSENIDFLNVGDKVYLNNLLNQSKIFVMTSQGEGLPMAAVEAMGCGLPVAIFDDADICDVCVHGHNSMVSPLWDTTSMAQNIQTMLTDSVLYNKLAEGALNFKNEKEYEYSLENIKSIWDNILSKF